MRSTCYRPGAQQIEGSLMHQAVVAQTPEGKLRAWVEEHYSHVLFLSEKDSGTKLETLYTACTTTVPPVHTKALGLNTLSKMLKNSIYPGVGPHRGAAGETGIYLIRLKKNPGDWEFCEDLKWAYEFYFRLQKPQCIRPMT